MNEMMKLMAVANNELDEVNGELEIQKEKLTKIKEKTTVYSHLLKTNKKLINDVSKALNAKRNVYLVCFILVLFVITIMLIKYPHAFTKAWTYVIYGISLVWSKIK